MTDTSPAHPSSLSDADRAALIASDPAAFDDDSTPTDEDEGGEGGEGGEGEGDEGGGDEGGAKASEAEAAGKAPDAPDATDAPGGDSDKAPPARIPAQRLNEVIDQRNQAESLVKSQAVELAALREKMATTEAPKDFDAEFDKLLQQFEEGDTDTAQFERDKRKLANEEASHYARINAMKTQQESLTQAVERSWEQDVSAWSASNPGFMAGDGNSAVLQRAVNAVAAFHGETISNAQLLAKAGAMAFEETGYQAPAGTASGADLGAGRRIQNSQRAADASGAPPSVAGGVGDRGGPDRGVDLSNLKPGNFSKKLTPAEQEKLLGPGAL